MWTNHPDKSFPEKLFLYYLNVYNMSAARLSLVFQANKPVWTKFIQKNIFGQHNRICTRNNNYNYYFEV